MKERPILLSAPMVRAVLDGRKTQTRRIIKPQPYVDRPGNFCWNGSNFGQDFNGPRIQAIASPIPSSKTKRVLCPYGKPGDRLWVRETWQGPLLEYAGDYQKVNRGLSINDPEHCAYRATDKMDAVDEDGKELGWRPSIHMPRWASRILLEVTSVCVERLRDISAQDAIAEGIETVRVSESDCRYVNYCRKGKFPEKEATVGSAIRSYATLWESINGAGSWDANPWVWVIEFKQAKGGAA